MERQEKVDFLAGPGGLQDNAGTLWGDGGVSELSLGLTGVEFGGLIWITHQQWTGGALVHTKREAGSLFCTRGEERGNLICCVFGSFTILDH